MGNRERAGVKMFMLRRQYSCLPDFGVRHGFSPSIMSLYHEFASVLWDVTNTRIALDSAIINEDDD